jgi:hypothetical protein
MWWRGRWLGLGQQSPHVMFNGSDKIEIADALNVLSCIARFGRIYSYVGGPPRGVVGIAATPSHSLSPWTTGTAVASGNGANAALLSRRESCWWALDQNTPLIFRLGTTGCELLVPQATKWGEVVCVERDKSPDHRGGPVSSHSLCHKRQPREEEEAC